MTISWMPLKSVATVRVSNVDKKTVEGDQSVRLCNYTDVYYNNAISEDMSFMSATATREQIRIFGLRKDDVVITKDSETAEDIGIAAYVKSSDRDLVCGYHLAILRPNRKRIHGRFLYWSLVSRHLRDQFAVSATGVTRFGLRSESIAGVKVALYSLEKQVVITDFLDAETDRIDALIGKKRQMLQLLIERSAAIVEQEVRKLAKRHGEQRLKTAVRDVTVGIVITPSLWYADQGVPALRGLNVRPYTIDLTDLVRLSAEGDRIHEKSKLYSGDVVVVRTGQAGAAAVVPSELDGANCIDLLIVRPGSLDARFLVYVLNSDWTRKHISKYSVGTIQSHFNVSSLTELPIPVPPLDEQRRFALDIVTQLTRLETAQAKLRNQLELLQEHRLALITAAVTREMDVPGVST
ncbi:MAG: restriction endonuclease subunit S [Pseudonocardiaceae bacterium]